MGQGRLYLQSQKGCQGLASLGSVLTTGAVMVTRYFVLIFDKKKKKNFFVESGLVVYTCSPSMCRYGRVEVGRSRIDSTVLAWAIM